MDPVLAATHQALSRAFFRLPAATPAPTVVSSAGIAAAPAKEDLQPPDVASVAVSDTLSAVSGSVAETGGSVAKIAAGSAEGKQLVRRQMVTLM